MDPLFFLTSVLAVLALAGVNWWLDREGRLSRPLSPVARRLAEELIDFTAREAVFGNDGKAYIALGEGVRDIALARRLGDGWVVRRLGPGGIRKVMRDGAMVRLRLDDFTWPRWDLSLADEKAARVWARRLALLATRPASAAEGVADGPA